MNNLVRAILETAVIVSNFRNSRFIPRAEFERTLPNHYVNNSRVLVPAYVSYKGVTYLDELNLVPSDKDGDYMAEEFSMDEEDLQAPYTEQMIELYCNEGDGYYNYADLSTKPYDANALVVWRPIYKTGSAIRFKEYAAPKIGLVWSDADGANYAIVQHDANNNAYKVLTDSAVYASGWHLDVSILPGYPVRTVGTYPWVRI